MNLIYYNVDRRRLTDADGAAIITKPDITAGTKPVWTLALRHDGACITHIPAEAYYGIMPEVDHVKDGPIMGWGESFDRPVGGPCYTYYGAWWFLLPNGLDIKDAIKQLSVR